VNHEIGVMPTVSFGETRSPLLFPPFEPVS